MKAIFIDCNDQLAPVWAKVIRAGRSQDRSQPQRRLRARNCRACSATTTVALDDHSYMPTELVAQCPALKHIVFLGTGAASYMNVDELKGRGVTVHTIKGYGDTAVAEHTIALMFAAARDVARMDREVRAGVWTPQEGVQLLGKTLGVIGLGGIGREVARIGRGIGMEVIGYNRTRARRCALPAGRHRRIAGAVGRGVAQPGAQRRDPRLPEQGAHRAHEAGRDPGQHRARRAGRRSGADRRRCKAATSAMPGSTSSTTSR